MARFDTQHLCDLFVLLCSPEDSNVSRRIVIEFVIPIQKRLTINSIRYHYISKFQSTSLI